MLGVMRPCFPRRRGLRGLEAHAAPAGWRPCVLDAGCGLGDGLKALRAAYPRRAAARAGMELAAGLLCRLRCLLGQGAPRRYLGRRTGVPMRWCICSSARKAWPAWPRRPAPEMVPGNWLVSLAFELPGVRPSMRLQSFAGHGVGGLPPAIAANGGRRRLANDGPMLFATQRQRR